MKSFVSILHKAFFFCFFTLTFEFILDVTSSLSGKRRGIWYLLKSTNNEYKFVSCAETKLKFSQLLLDFFEKNQPKIKQTNTAQAKNGM